MSKKPDPDKAAIRALDAEWSKAATANDFDRVVKFYAKDGSVVWPDQPIATGHKAIRASWKKAFNDAPGMYLDFKPTHIEISSGGDMASDFGLVHFAPNAKPGDTQNTAKYLVVWKREKGAWKVLYDSWNWNSMPVITRS
jgi:uncharacterized protein (TIGR02246 family)